MSIQFFKVQSLRIVNEDSDASDPNTLAEYPTADIEVAKIGELIGCDLSAFLKTCED